MSFKPEEKDWMAYLYDELEGEEKQRMELYLLENPEARQELTRFENIRSVLRSIEDQEVIAPPIFIGETRQRSLWNSPGLKLALSIAASLILVILVAKFTGLRMDVSNNEFRLGFGEPETKTIEKPQELTETSTKGITQDEVQAMIAAALQQNNNSLQANWKESQAKFDASIRKNLATNTERIDGLMQQAATASQDQVREYIASLQAENMNQVKDYFQLTSNEQKKYMENLLVDFAQYLQQQRNNDLQIVQSQMQSLEQNTNIFKKETEQILTGIISSVRSNENPAETKN
jgi:membrane-associated HD superfamily phosphohydrolase